MCQVLFMPKKSKRTLGRPPGADSDATRTLLLEGSLEAFGESGYEAMSVRALTRRLGVSHNLVHHYFGSKRDLWMAALDHVLEAKKVEILEILASGSGAPDEAEITLREVIGRVVTLMAELPALPRIFVQESAAGGDRLDALFDRYLGPGLNAVEGFLSRIPSTAQPRPDVRSMLMFLAGGIPALFTHSALAKRVIGPDALEAESRERFVDATTKVLLNGIL